MTEALIGMAVTAVGLLSLGKFQSVALLASGQSKARTEAMALAEREIEQLRNYATLTEFDDDITTATSTWAGQNADFDITRTVTSSAAPNFKTVTATITWTDKTGEQSVELTSFIGRGDPLNASKVMLTPVGGLDYPVGGLPDDSGGTDPDDNGDSSPPDDGLPGASDGNGNDDSDDAYNDPNFIYVKISGSIELLDPSAQVRHLFADGNYAMDCQFGDTFYTCESEAIPSGNSWSGVVTLTTNKYVCGGHGNLSYENLTSDYGHSYTIARSQRFCP
jgi:hypothetical protein